MAKNGRFRRKKLRTTAYELVKEMQKGHPLEHQKLANKIVEDSRKTRGKKIYLAQFF